MANPAIDLNAETPLEDENPNPTETLPESSPKSDPQTEPPNNDPEASPTVAKPTGSVETAAAPANHIEKKIRRAERFGVPVQLTEQEKRNSRAQRFGSGSTLPSSEVSKDAEEQKRKTRAERFGLPGPSAATDEGAKKKARRERFGSIPTKADPAEEEKRKARALRFANPQSNSSAKINGNGDAVQKAAVAGKATEGA